MRVKHFDYVAKGVELNLTNDECFILRAFIDEYFWRMDAGEVNSPIMTKFGKRLLKRLPKDKD